MRWKQPGPLVKMTLALVTMTVSIVLLADLLLGVTGSRERQLQLVRQQLSESVAVQSAVLLQAGEEATLERTLRQLLVRVKDLRSIGIRRDDGALLLAVGPHREQWKVVAENGSTPDQVRVPLAANGQSWGAVEVAYQTDALGWWARLLRSPLARMVVFVVIVGSIGYAMYMRRALQHLDPASVIPERVQRAFDAMAEGVVVLDARARVMLANRAFRVMGDHEEPLRVGQPLSSVAWLAAALPDDLAAHPWMRAMAGDTNRFDDTLVMPGLGTGAAAHEPARTVVVSCAPINDTGGAVRGCMVTFNDMTELHRANAALQRAMAEVQAGKEELQRKNLELQQLATRDAMTGCLNRRAFMQAAPGLLSSAQLKRTALGCLMLDIDHFKAINDTHGHGVGDRVITEVAQVMLQLTRKGDLVCRYGGEEFCIVAPGHDARAVAALGERIRAQVQAMAGARVAEVAGLKVTISVGVASLEGSDDALPALVDRADQALYKAKRSGRNRVAEFTAEAMPAAEVAG